MEVWGGNAPASSGVVMAGLDAWVYSKPYQDESSGGDVYYVSSCATGRITRMLIADVSGHGEIVSRVAVELRRLMRKCINHLDQRVFVRAMNGQFSQLAKDGQFATAIALTFFGPTNELAVCNAGHPPPMVYRRLSRRWEYMEEAPARAENFPLGIVEMSEYDQFDRRLKLGDCVIAYTDGVVESRNSTGEFLGAQKLLEITNSVALDPPESFIERWLAAIESHNGARIEDDDVTVMLCRVNGLAPKASLTNRALAPWRIMKTVVDAMVGKGPMSLPDFKLANLGGGVLAFFDRFGMRRG